MSSRIRLVFVFSAGGAGKRLGWEFLPLTERILARAPIKDLLGRNDPPFCPLGASQPGFKGRVRQDEAAEPPRRDGGDQCGPQGRSTATGGSGTKDGRAAG